MVVRCSPLDRRAARFRGAFAWLLVGLLAALLGCSRHEHGGDAAHSHGETSGAEPWAVTAWGQIYEIFPEVDPLVAGQAAESHTHVTALADFSPLIQGDVAIVLRAADGSEEIFRATQAKRPGIFAIEVTPQRAGEFDLLFRVEAAPGREEIAGGRVRVGESGSPGGLVAPPLPTQRAEEAAAAAGGEEISFLKEQQWKTPFATEWTREGELAATRVAPARVVSRPGGDRIVTAPADGVLLASPFPHPGLLRRTGAPLFALTPRLDPERSLAALDGEVAGAEAELVLASTEAQRARELVKAGVVSASELDRAEATLAVATAHAEATRRDAATSRRARGGGGGGTEAVVIGAPFDGAVAAVAASAGQAVEAGDELGRFIASGPPWIEAWVAPEAVAGLSPGPTRVSLSTGTGSTAPEWADLPARLVAISPALDPASGRRTLLFELLSVPPALAVGQSIEVELQAGTMERGIVVPAAALIDDAGIAVVYVQASGETLRRREVRVVARAGERRLVSGLVPGERIVTLGGTAVRRSSLVSSGVGEGHVH
ncbi:MAG: efflux RND transporter periplasmic adaptor subunit [Thermoanaerobaculia bacterium]